jgi:hypothetical protein
MNTNNATLSTAQKRNAEYQKSYYVNRKYDDIQTRFDETIKNKPLAAQAAIWKAIGATKKHWLTDEQKKKIVTVSDLKLPVPGTLAMNKFRIDDLFQRLMDLDHGLNIVNHWDSAQINPISVYFDAVTGDAMCFDGQHTLFALWFVITQVMGLGDDTQVPVMIYDAEVASRQRELFIAINDGSNKKPVEAIDIFRQEVLAYRLNDDRSTNSIRAHNLQMIMESHDMFLTNEKFNDHNEPGACPRIREWLEYPSQVAETYARYFKISGANLCRPSESNEQDILFEVFDQFRKASIMLTDQDLKNLHDWMRFKFGAEFRPANRQGYQGSDFYLNCRTSFNNWWNQYTNQFGLTQVTKPQFSTKYYIYGFVYLTASLTAAVKNKQLTLSKVPKTWTHTNNDGYTPLAADLI